MDENPEAERLADALQRGMDLVDRLRHERDVAIAELDAFLSLSPAVAMQQGIALIDRLRCERDRAVAERDAILALFPDEPGPVSGMTSYSVVWHFHPPTEEYPRGLTGWNFINSLIFHHDLHPTPRAALRAAAGLDSIGSEAGEPQGEGGNRR